MGGIGGGGAYLACSPQVSDFLTCKSRDLLVTNIRC